MQLFKIIGTTLLTLALSAQANAFFKCGSGFVDTGDVKGVVQVKCGEPVYKSVDSGSDSEILKESWTYDNYGGKGWMTTLHFERGVLTRIESLGRVR